MLVVDFTRCGFASGCVKCRIVLSASTFKILSKSNGDMPTLGILNFEVNSTYNITQLSFKHDYFSFPSRAHLPFFTNDNGHWAK